jgi:hypothetical protein
MTGRLKTYIHEDQARLKQQVQPFIQKKRSLQHQHQNERFRLQEKQEKRWQEESRERSQKLPKGIKGIGFGLLAGTTESGSKMNAKRKHAVSEIGVKCSRLLISSLLSVRSCKIKSNPF